MKEARVKKYKLLLLDDEEDLLEILLDVLEDGGIAEISEIITVMNGLEGLEAVAKHDFDCIVSDINMPKMNGIAFVKEVQGNGFSKPVIFLSAHGDPETIKKTEKLDIFNFIQKPFDENDLCSKINEAFKHSA